MNWKATIVWFRQDLRLQDNPALAAAMARGGAVVPVFVWDEEGDGRWTAGTAARWWLQQSLAGLAASLGERGGRLTLRRGQAERVLRDVARETGAEAMYWNRGYEPASVARETRVEAALAEAGVETRRFNGTLLHEPDAVANRQGRPFQVFTPYWRHCLSIPVAPPMRLAAAGEWAAPTAGWPRTEALSEWAFLADAGGAARFGASWKPGEAEARRRLAEFVAKGMDEYDEARDWPAVDGTSRLSAALHFGEISSRQIWAAVRAKSKSSGVFPPSKGARVFVSEIGWREFAYHQLFHFPWTPDRPMREEFARFPWAEDKGGERLRAWQEGRTGYPIVDAGMRQLRATGWMHNRVRMIAASFLVKHLRLSWTEGAAWFWETLIDADLANNTLGWQWSAGCGADASPYFRIFAPVLQGRKFDANGDYVRRWVPELAALPTKTIHAPWEAEAGVLAEAGVRLGETYPRPIVDHATARAEALAAFKGLRELKGRDEIKRRTGDERRTAGTAVPTS